MTPEKVLLGVWAVMLAWWFRRELASAALNAFDRFGSRQVTVREPVDFNEALKPPYRAFRSER